MSYTKRSIEKNKIFFEFHEQHEVLVRYGVMQF